MAANFIWGMCTGGENGFRTSDLGIREGAAAEAAGSLYGKYEKSKKRGAGCGMREGVPLMRHNFYMGDVLRRGEMPGWVERSGPPKFGGLRAAVGGCTIVQGTYKAEWQKVHGTNEEISKQENSPHSLPEVRAAPKGRRGCTVVRVENEIKVTCIPGELSAKQTEGAKGWDGRKLSFPMYHLL